MKASANFDKSLEPPGAGLPQIERWVALLAVKIIPRFWTHERALSQFQRVAEKIFERVGQLDAGTCIRRVLIPRIRGIEDSSRYWSIYMVLKHVTVVNNSVLDLLETIASGRPYNREVRIEDVKPEDQIGEEALQEFNHSVASFKKRVQELDPESLKGTKVVHPWFGGLEGHEWLCLAAVHLSIHRRQIEEILRSMESEASS